MYLLDFQVVTPPRGAEGQSEPLPVACAEPRAQNFDVALGSGTTCLFHELKITYVISNVSILIRKAKHNLIIKLTV